MKYKYTILIISGLLFGSCTTTKDNLNVTESYSLIVSSFNLTKDAHQKLIDRYSESLNAIKNDEDTLIDTKGLYILLDSAKLTNQKSSSMVNLAGEINDTKYKETALKYINLLDKLYNNELKKYIVVLANQSKDRYEKSSKLLFSRQEELEKLDEKFSYAANQVRTMYHLEIVDSSQMTK